MIKQLSKISYLNLGAFCFVNQNRHFPPPASLSGNSFKVKTETQINNRAHMLKLHWPNQSLKLTEPAVDDLARAKQPVTIGHGLSSRGLDSVAAALRGRSLAPVR